MPGDPLTLSPVASRVLGPGGRVEAEWLLASNVESAAAGQVARWYALRWRVESFFELLKGQGQQVEDWQQESGGAVRKRLAVAGVLAWRRARDATKPGRKLAALLARLSGRQAKRGTAPSASAILAGLEKLPAVLALLDQTPLEGLKELLSEMLPGLRGTG